MRCICPKCAAVLVQNRNPEGLNYCTECQTLFLVPAERQVPVWVLGVVTFLMANMQMLYWH